MLGLIAKTKQGCDILKHHNWDAVRHSRRQPWPVVPDDMEQLCNELSSIPSTLSLNSESTSSRHNSESESAPSSKLKKETEDKTSILLLLSTSCQDEVQASGSKVILPTEKSASRGTVLRTFKEM